MQKFKYLKSIIIVFVCSVLYWCMVELPVITRLKEDSFIEDTEEHQILAVVGHSGGYEDILGIILFVSLFCFCLNFLLLPYTEMLFVRLNSRKKYIIYNMKHTIIFSILFAIIHEVINMIGMLLCFSVSALENLQFFRCMFISFAAITLFYIHVGIILQLLNICIIRKYTSVIVFLMYMFEYLLIRVKFINWAPCCDGAILLRLLEKRISKERIIFLFSENIFVCLLLVIILNYLFLQKDILKNET